MNVIGDVKGALAGYRRLDRYPRDAGEEATSAHGNGASQVYAVRFAPGAFGRGGAKHFAVMHHRVVVTNTIR